MSKSQFARPSLRRTAILFHVVLATLLAPAAFAFDSGGTGADGALSPTVNTEIQLPPSGILNYTSINIPAGVTVKFKRNTLNTPAYLLVSGGVTIAGSIDVRGEDAKHIGTYGDGNQADDGISGRGGPGGFDGGRGGRDDLSQRVDIIRGGAGLGPGGGKGGIEGGDGCSGFRYFKYMGLSGAYAGNGSTGNYTNYYCGGVTFPTPEQAKPYGSALLQPLIGGSGGGGGRGGTNFAGSGGGGGGGAILIAASGTVQITGSIDATGGDAGGVSGTGAGGNGAGGSGGAIRIVATAITGNGALSANGGCTNMNNTRRQGCNDSYGNGYGGSGGRIRVEADSLTYSGPSSPSYTTDLPGPVFLSSVPSLRIASVAGVNAPTNPTGNADVVLPATVQNPATVAIETTNVPTGNTVVVKLIPAYGNPSEVLSPALAGTTASGSTSVQVTLPQGPSVLQATTTYTVVVAMGDALSQYANNERVEKVQITATLGSRGENQVKLITVSGKEFMVPAAVLQLAGVMG